MSITMRTVFKGLLLCCVTIAAWELYVFRDSLSSVLDSVKPVAANGYQAGENRRTVIVTESIGNITTNKSGIKDARDPKGLVVMSRVRDQNPNEQKLNETLANATDSDRMTSHVQSSKSDETNIESNDHPNDQRNRATTIPKNNEEIKVNSKDRLYLFPLHYDYNGPNVQYGSFMRGVAFALAYKRTVVENWFHTHWTSGRKLMKYVNETFDLGKLKQLVDVATVHDFKRDCNSTVERLLMHPYYRMGSTKTKNDYLQRYAFKKEGLEKYYGIKLPDNSHIPETSAQAEELLLNPPTTRCLGVLDPNIDTRWEFPALRQQYYKVDTHFVSPPIINKIADDVEKKLCDGDPFMALHWRNRTGEVCGHLTRECGNIPRIAAVNKTAEVAANDILKLMQARNLTCLYVAVPFFSVTMITILKNAKIPRVKSFSDITTQDYPDIGQIKYDGYMVSRLEQEICARSSTFVRTSHSSWSAFADRWRVIQGKESLGLETIVSWIAPGVTLK